MLGNGTPASRDEPQEGPAVGLALDDPAVADAVDEYLRELAAGR
jgi:hypothetical protein